MIPPIFTVYFTTPLCFEKKLSSVFVKNHTKINGIIYPNVYTAISPNPFAEEPAVAAIISTDESTGPMQGVHAKLITNPINIAVIGDIVIFSN